MFKLWRNDKNKIKTVFKLQFQVTQVPKLKKPALTISLVPEDVGKPTMRLEKTAVQDGTCSWENPLYATMKLVKEPKTGKFNEKIYHFLVSTGSSKSGYLGEASIDFADFAEEIEALTVSLPLKFANSGAILHVTIQKMEGVTDPRYIVENEDLTLSQDGSLKSEQINRNASGNNLNDDEVKSPILQDGEQDGSFGSFNEQNSRQVFGLTNSPLRQNSMPKKGNGDVNKTKPNMHRRSCTDWSVGSASDGSLADSSYGLEENLPREYQDASNDATEKLKGEIAGLMRQAELSELEIQSLWKQITKETKRAQDLSRQISSVKEERDTLKTECEQLKSQKCIDNTEVINRLRSENEDLRVLVEEMKQELDQEEDSKANIRLQLQKTQGSNSELLLAVRDLNEMLEEKNREISRLSTKIEAMETVVEDLEIKSKHNRNEDEHQLALGDLADMQDDVKEADMLKEKVTDLESEIEFYRKHKEELETHIEQLSQDFEVLKQENNDIRKQHSESMAAVKELELQIEELEEKIKQQSLEYSESLIAINDLESQVKELKKELEKQAQEFHHDLEAVIQAKTEQEQRAIQAEEALRKTRRQNAITAERLQEKFKRLSAEMTSKFDENEKVTNEVLAEANDLRTQKRILEEKLQKANDELGLGRDQNEAKLQELAKQLDLREKQTEQMSLQLDQKSKQRQDAENCEKEKHDTLSAEIHMLRSEIERLTREKCEFTKQAEQKAKLNDEMEQMKTSKSETEMLIQRWNKERENLEKNFASAKKEAEKAQKELLSMRGLKDEKETMIRNLQSDVENLRVQHNSLKHSLSEEELEKDKLRKEILQLKDKMQSKEDSVPIQNGAMMAPLRRNGENFSENELKDFTSHTGNGGYLAELAVLRERNKCMERELKEMEERYSEISLKFAEVEGERQQMVMTIRNLKNGRKS